MRLFNHTLTICISTACLLSACSKQLDEQVYSDLTSQGYTFTEADYYGVTTKVYTGLRSLWGEQDFYMAQESTTDAIVMPANGSGWDDGGLYKRMHLHGWNAEQSHVRNTWNKLFQGILNANTIIQQLETDEVPVPAAVGKAAAIAEIKAVRAFYYWLICDNFGDAPLVSTVTQELPENASRRQLYDFIVSELTASIPALTEEKNGITYGKFNKWVAKTVLANVYLNAKVYVGEDHWTDCLAQCNDIIGSNKYTLATNYRDNFLTDNVSSPETIFAIPFDQTLATNFYVHMYSWHAALRNKFDMTTTPYGAGSAKGVPQFIDTYDPEDQRLPDSWLMGQQFASNGTTALLGSYDKSGQPLVFTNSMPDGLYTGEADGYRMNKFEVALGAMRDLSNDFPFFRYSEVLLMKAECLLRTGKADEAATIVSDLRVRNFRSAPVKATVTGAQLEGNSKYQYGYVENGVVVDPGNTAVVPFGGMLDELGWEFAWEGHRRRDMIRFGTYTSKSWLSHKPAGDYRAVFPIPQEAINTNPKLIQNPDYN
ncbi:MAG: RagB/SusD family nutrient uptake outer membrane protein [Candidatus Pseudobacter hemicellulosilyticus]|uniref:RagB/SusD family nutrient uptake outer membrane protein n=1 Tax=Candidatus Pseudobacter hemicellulosilyticus TaxID=3121375 RepID=A0AAJ6BEB2_9BACT|nr:MAG: RagB/SusD family nutrient uptake outer membrane protein [Pseudobacter sp.]